MQKLLALCFILASLPIVGCSVSREPEPVIEPSYSYLADEPELAHADIWPVRESLRASANADDAPIASIEGYGDPTLSGSLILRGQPTTDPLSRD